jgi:hypothetical protein
MNTRTHTLCTPLPARPARRLPSLAAVLAWLDRCARCVRAFSGDSLEHYLEGSVDHADLEYRMRLWHDARSRGGPVGRH